MHGYSITFSTKLAIFYRSAVMWDANVHGLLQ